MNRRTEQEYTLFENERSQKSIATLLEDEVKAI